MVTGSAGFSPSADSADLHARAGVVGRAFYLTVEGDAIAGVAGVGPAKRALIEQVFFRAFVYMLPPDATFSMARGGYRAGRTRHVRRGQRRGARAHGGVDRRRGEGRLGIEGQPASACRSS
jgi:hypothetical protein